MKNTKSLICMQEQKSEQKKEIRESKLKNQRIQNVNQI
jgi:hypothetical protein